MNSNRSLNGSGSGHVTSECHKIGLSYDAVVDVDGKLIGWIARTALRYKIQTPGSVVNGGCARACKRSQCHAGHCNDDQSFLHEDISVGIVSGTSGPSNITE